jgi:hypothetical protein
MRGACTENETNCKCALRTYSDSDIYIIYSFILVLPVSLQHWLVGGGGGGVADIWDDSGEDENEDYMRAKRMSAMAAKKKKDTKLMIARGRV